jgi:hypothetical protein
MNKALFGIIIGTLLALLTVSFSVVSNETMGDIIYVDDNDTWVQTYGGLNFDAGTSVQQTSDGGYIIVGATSTSFCLFGHTDVWLIKTDNKGNMIWGKIFGGRGDDMGSSVMQTNDGGYIITGYTRSYGNGNKDVWLLKTDENGQKIWDRTFGYGDFDSGSEVKQTSDDGYIIVGNVNTSGGGRGDIWLIKVDSNGNKLWDKSFGGRGHNYGESIQQTSDGGYIIIGSSWVPGETNSYDIWLIKTDSTGELVWDEKYHGTDSDHGWSLEQTFDGGFIVVGMTKSGVGDDDIWLFKTDRNGTVVWDKVFDGVGQNRGYSVKQTSDGGYVIAGDTYKSFRMKALLIKTDSNGDEEWVKTYGGLGDGIVFSVQQTDDGGYILTGYESIFRNEDLWLIKTDSEGNAPKKYIRNSIRKSDIQNTINHNKGLALIAGIYLELDPDSPQAQEIVDNFRRTPRGMLIHIDVTVTEPNKDYYLFIAPFFKTFIPQILYNDSQSNMVFPEETVTLRIPLFWGDVREWAEGYGRPERLIVDGWAILLSWKY